jgi:hypothetical protein
MQILPPEIEEGNSEYKRLFKNLEDKRINELTTQMKWRLDEGNDICHYFIGIDDDGSLYQELSTKDIKYSFKILKILSEKCNSKIYKVKRNIVDKKYLWFKISIKRNNKIFSSVKYILLLGPTNSRKTTFLSYLIKNKIDTEENKARNFILNYKHEIETGKTSSINYQSIIFNKVKYIFIDTPGDIDYNRTTNKCLLNFDFDLILSFSQKWDRYDLYSNYILEKDINSIDFTFDKNNKLTREDYFNKFNKFNNINKCNKCNNDVNFIVFQSFPHHDIGLILSGYLNSGTLYVNQNLNWYTQNKINLSIISIYRDNISISKTSSPSIVTICVRMKENVIDYQKIKYGFLSNKKYNAIDKIKLKWIWKSKDIPKSINININNLSLRLDLLENNIYQVVDKIVYLNAFNNNFICSMKDFQGIGHIVC